MIIKVETDQTGAQSTCHLCASIHNDPLSEKLRRVGHTLALSANIQIHWQISFWGTFALIWWFAITWAFPLSAASVETAISPEMREIGCTVRLNGVIEPGDFEKLSAVLSIPPKYDDPNWPRIFSPSINYGFPFATHRLCLNSPGGSFLEALRIAEGFQQFRDEENKPGIPTGIARGNRCESACALVFMSGRYSWLENSESYWRPNQVMHPDAILGFHSPIITLDNEYYSRDEALHIWAIGMKAVSLLSQQINAGNIFINQRLFSEMAETIPPDMLSVRTVGDAVRLGINVVYPSLDLVPFTEAELATNLCLNAATIASDRFQLAYERGIGGGQVTTDGAYVVGGFRSRVSGREYSCSTQPYRTLAFDSEYYGGRADAHFITNLDNVGGTVDVALKTGLFMFPPETRLSDLFTLSDDPENVESRFMLCPNMDNPALDLSSDGIRNISLAECVSTCERDLNCGGFSYVRSSGWCWPKSEASCSEHSRRNPKPVEKAGVISGVR